MLSRACEYGIKATVFLAQKAKEEKLSNVKEIAKAIDSPEAFTAKVLQQLVRCSIIHSIKGAQGGFYIDKKALKKLNLLQIVVAIDGDGLMQNCMLGLSECSEKNPCPVHSKYKKIKEGIVHMLKTTFVDELQENVMQKISVLKN